MFCLLDKEKIMAIRRMSTLPIHRIDEEEKRLEASKYLRKLNQEQQKMYKNINMSATVINIARWKYNFSHLV